MSRPTGKPEYRLVLEAVRDEIRHFGATAELVVEMPHPKIVVTLQGLTRKMAFAGSPRRGQEDQLRAIRRQARQKIDEMWIEITAL